MIIVNLKKQILMFSSGQETNNTENMFLTNLRVWMYGMGAYLHCVVSSFPHDLLVAHL